MEVKKYHSAVILLGQYVAVQIFLHYSTGNLSEAGPMADCLRQNRIPKNHGLGLRNIEVCAEKYYGKTEVTVREDEFELAVMLQERIE